MLRQFHEKLSGQRERCRRWKFAKKRFYCAYNKKFTEWGKIIEIFDRGRII